MIKRILAVGLGLALLLCSAINMAFGVTKEEANACMADLYVYSPKVPKEVEDKAMEAFIQERENKVFLLKDSHFFIMTEQRSTGIWGKGLRCMTSIRTSGANSIASPFFIKNTLAARWL